MKFLIVGGGKSGSYIAEELKKEHEVTLIESSQEQIDFLKTKLPEVNIIHGDGCELYILEKAGIKQMDVVAALTGDDEDNLVISFLSKFQNNVPLVFSRINHPKNEWLFQKNWGVDIAVSATTIIANLMKEEISLGEIVTLLKLRKENLAIDQITLPPKSTSIGKKISELKLPDNCHIIAIISDTKVKIPRGEIVLEENDKLFIISSIGTEEEIMKALGVPV